MADRSNWADASDVLRRAREVQLICLRNCGAMNRPGALLIHLDPDGLAVCDGCGYAWRPDFPKETR